MFEPKYKTQWSMDEQDIIRLSSLLINMNDASINVMNGKRTAIMPLYSIMFEIYSSVLRPLIYRNDVIESDGLDESGKKKYKKRYVTFDDKFESLRKAIHRWTRSPDYYTNKPIKKDIFNDIMLLKNELMVLRLQLGLSVKTTRHLNTEEKGRRVIVGK